MSEMINHSYLIQRRNGSHADSVYGMADEPATSSTFYTLIMPLEDSHGRPIDPQHIRWVREQLQENAGGLTCLSPGRGFWVDGQGRLCEDRIVPLQVVVQSTEGFQIWFAAFMSEMAWRFKQQEIFAFTQSVHRFELLSAPSNGSSVMYSSS